VFDFWNFPTRELWNLLRALSIRSNLPWVCIGDFNDLLQLEDKKGDNPHLLSLLQGFRNIVEDCNLIDISLMGYPFTWERGKGTPAQVQECLDRALCTNSWQSHYQNVELLNLTVKTSNHNPIYLVVHKLFFHHKHFRFHFKNAWTKEPNKQILDRFQQCSYRFAQ
jgi:hypothetical protein